MFYIISLRVTNSNSLSKNVSKLGNRCFGQIMLSLMTNILRGNVKKGIDLKIDSSKSISIVEPGSTSRS